MNRAALLIVFALACETPQPAVPPVKPAVPAVKDATLRYEGVVRMPGLAWGDFLTASIEIRAIPGQALRVDAFVSSHPAQIRARVPVAFTYSFLETHDAYHVRAWMPGSPEAVRDVVVPYLNMRVARKDVPDPLLLPPEAPLRLVFDPIPVTAAFSPDLLGSSGERAWSEVTADGTIARALPVRTLTKRVDPSCFCLRASIRSADVVAITYEARTLSTRELKGGMTIPDRLRLQWEIVDRSGGRMVLASTLLHLAGEPELNSGLAVEDLERGFDRSNSDAVLRVPADYGAGYLRALALAKASILAGLARREEPTPTGRAQFLKAFDGAKEATPAAAAAYAELCGRNGLDGEFAKIIRAAEEKQPFTLPEATLALAASMKKDDAVHVLNRGLGGETYSGWQRRFRAALVARDPSALELHLGALEGSDIVARFADETVLELIDNDPAADAFRKLVAEGANDPATALVALRVAAWESVPEDLVEACLRISDAPALAAVLPFVHGSIDLVLKQKNPERMETLAPAAKQLAAAATAALPEDPRATLLAVDAARLAGEEPNEQASKLLDQIEKASAAEGWDIMLIIALGEACREAGQKKDRASLERGVRLLAAAMNQAPTSINDLSQDVSLNPAVLLTALTLDARDWNGFFAILDVPGMRLKPFEYGFWEAVMARADAATFRDRVIAALAAGTFSARACRVFVEGRSYGGNTIDAAAILEKATEAHPKDAALWTLRGRVAGKAPRALDFYRKAIELDEGAIEASVAVAESLKPDDAARMLDRFPVSDEGRPFANRIMKVYSAAGRTDAARKWAGLTGAP